MTRQPTLLIVNPRRKYRYHWDLYELCEIMGKKAGVVPLSLPTLAAMVPGNFKIELIDEHMEPIRFHPVPDLVAITSLGPNIKRAFAVADEFKKLGATVVMGGPQVSFIPDESLTHCDAILIGEAEGVWEEMLADFEKGELKKRYQRADIYDFKVMPKPRWDLVDITGVMALGVQASRGCPYTCDFCLVRNMFGKHHRYRDMDNLIEEIKGLPKRQITFVDDNLTANKPYARELMKRLKPLKVSWMCQSSLELVDDEPLIKAMAEAGCTAILLGFESVNPESLQETGKKQNKIDRYEKGIKTIQSYGIHIIGSFIVGFDSDDLSAFDHINDFILKNNLSYIMLNILTAYPGTDLYKRMLDAGRVTNIDPDLLNGLFPTMRYMKMSQVEVFDRYFETMEKIFDYDNVRKKAVEIFSTGAFTRYNEADVTAREKAGSLLHLMRRYLFTGNAKSRRLLLALLGQVFRRKASMGNIIEFLLLISSFNGYLAFTREHRDEILEMIRNQDPGAIEAG